MQNVKQNENFYSNNCYFILAFDLFMHSIFLSDCEEEEDEGKREKKMLRRTSRVQKKRKKTNFPRYLIFKCSYKCEVQVIM